MAETTTEDQLAAMGRRADYAAHLEDHGGLVDVRHYVELYARDVPLLLERAERLEKVMDRVADALTVAIASGYWADVQLARGELRAALAGDAPGRGRRSDG